jgi:hypothetical protein
MRITAGYAVAGLLRENGNAAHKSTANTQNMNVHISEKEKKSKRLCGIKKATGG